MEKYERVNPGKHAIWRGRVTKQFKKWKKKQEKEKTAPLREERIEFQILIYMAVSKLQSPTYNQIIDFCTSFGMKTNEVVGTLIKKIKEDDLSYIKPEDSSLIRIFEDLFELSKLEIPLTIKVMEVFDVFQNLEFEKPVEIIDFFEDLQKKYPNFVTLSSSSFDKKKDLITFKRLFPNHIKFKLNDRWAI